MSKGRVIFSILFVGLLVIACGGGGEPMQAPTSPPTEMTPTELLGATPPPMVNGADLLQERCTACHGLGRVEATSETEAEWEATVEGMRGYGAELTDDEAQTLVEYLVENYGP